MTDQIVKLYDNTWAIQDMGVRIFILAGSEKALVIDTGMSALPVQDIVRQVTDLPVMLLNTHADPDHIAGNDAFGEFFMHPSEAIVYHNIHHRKGKILPVFDGDEIDLGNRKLRVIHLPGHTPGSIAVLDISSRVLISGDPIQEHGRIFMFGAHRSMPDYIASLEKLETMISDIDEIWPSHADLPLSPDCIWRLHDGAAKILNREVSGKKTEFFGQEITVYDLGFTIFLCDE